MLKSSKIGNLKNTSESLLASLKKALDLASNHHFTDALEECKSTYGALYIMGFDGSAIVLKAASDILPKLENEEKSSLLKLFKEGINSVKHYLLNILAGGRDSPMKLWDIYEEILSELGRDAHPSHLFFPIMGDRLWHHENKYDEINEEKLAECRTQFSDNLLLWVKDNEKVDCLLRSSTALERIIIEQPTGNMFFGFLKASIAILTDLVIIEKLDNSFNKYVLGRIIKELSNYNGINFSPSINSTKSVLYYITFSDIETIKTRRIKDMHYIDEYIEEMQSESNREGIILDQDELAEAKVSLENVKDSWSKLVNNPDEIENLKYNISILVDKTAPFGNPAIKRIGDATTQVAYGILNKKIEVSELLIEEFAAILMLLEQAIESKGRVSPEYEQIVLSQIKRILAAIGNKSEELDSIPLLTADKEYLNNSINNSKLLVLSEISNGLLVVKDMLLFLSNEIDEESKEDAKESLKPLKGMISVLKMLQLFEGANCLQEIVNKSDIVVFAREVVKSDIPYLCESIAKLVLYLEAESSGDETALNFLGVQTDTVRSFVDYNDSDNDTIDGGFYKNEPTLRLDESGYDESSIESGNAGLAENEQKPMQEQEPNDELEVLMPLDKDMNGKDTPKMDDMFYFYLQDFSDQIENMKNGIQSLSENLSDKEVLNDIRRCFHTLKGSGRMVEDLRVLPNVAEKIESLLKEIIEKDIVLDDKFIDYMGYAITVFESWSINLSESGYTEINSSKLLNKNTIDKILHGDNKSEFHGLDEPVTVHETIEIDNVTPKSAVDLDNTERVESFTDSGSDEAVNDEVEVKQSDDKKRDEDGDSGTKEEINFEKILGSNDEVIIGNISINKEIYKLYIEESHETIENLKSALRDIKDNEIGKSLSDFMGYSHKLLSSSQSVGLSNIAEPSRLLEKWSDGHINRNTVPDDDELIAIEKIVIHIDEMCKAVERTEMLALNDDIVSLINYYINKKPEKVMEKEAEINVKNNIDESEIKKLKLSIKQDLEEQITLLRSHLGKLESMVMSLEDD